MSEAVGRDGQTSPAANRASQRLPVTLITGATSGIGLELAREFAKAGHGLMLVARGLDGLAEAKRQIAGEHSVPVRVVAADLATATGRDQVAGAVEEAGLYVDYLVNNAGFAIAGPLAENDPGELARMIELNVCALTDLTRRFWPGMLKRGRGGVLNVASLGGLVPGPYQAAYYASKSYVVSLSEAMAQEAAGKKVRVGVLAPGPVATEFHSRMGADNSYYLKVLGMMRPDEVARIGYTSFMCGQTVIIPGLSNMASAVALKYVPHFILVPLTAWLLKLRAKA